MSQPIGTGLPALIHHLPESDVIEHEPSSDCVCRPHPEAVGIRQTSPHGGQRVFVAVHHPLMPVPDR